MKRAVWVMVGLLAVVAAAALARPRKGGAGQAARGRATPLHLAAQSGNPEQVRRVLQNGPAPDARDAEGWTPLHRAAAGRHTEAVRLLLEAGADPDLLCGEARRSALHLAWSVARSMG
jgi:hypothetical protein